MKRKLLIGLALLLGYSTIYAQEITDAYKLSQRELRGTARFMSMGGAMGALGGDVSAITVNPAGIGVYRSSEVVTTLNFQNMTTKTFQNSIQHKDNKFRVNFNNLAVVGTFPLYNDVAPYLSVGFSYNREKDFNRKYRMQGTGTAGRGLGDYIANIANKNKLTSGDIGLGTSDDFDVWDSGAPWLTILGHNAFLMGESEIGKGGYKSTTGGLDFGQGIYVKESGQVDKFDFNVGTTFEDIISAGISISITDMNYKLYSEFGEDAFVNDNKGSYTIGNKLESEGTGTQVSLGVIVKPIDELRFGVAYHSPTWYNMKDRFFARISQDFSEIQSSLILPPGDEYFPNSIGTLQTESERNGMVDGFEYKLTTPDRWVFSAAGVLGKTAIISIDYELIDYSKMKFKRRDDYSNADFSDVNYDIKKKYRLASTLRVGGEYRITPQLSVRAGYAWEQSPYDKETTKQDRVNAEIHTAGTVTHFLLEKDTNYVTWGLGYKFTKNIYTDLAFVYKTQKADLYSHVLAEKASLKTNTFQGLLTLGFRF